MKKTKKTPRVVLVVLITLLVVAGLFIFRSYILGTLGIGAAVTGETNLAVKYESGLLADIKLGGGVNVTGGIDAATNQKYIGLTGSNATATPTCSATGTACITNYVPVCGVDGQTYSNSCVAASSCVAVASQGACPTTTTTPSTSNGCTSPSTVKATVTGSKFHLGTTKTVEATNEFNFGTKNTVLDPLTSTSPGLWLSRQNTFLRVKYDFNNTNKDTPVDVSIKFTGATLNSQSIKLVNKDPLESADTYSVDTATNTVKFHFVSESSATDIDGLAIYFYCNSASESPTSSVREGTISGTFDLGAVKNVTKFKTYSLSGSVNATCSKTDVTSSLSTDNVNWNNEKTSGSSDTVAYDQPIQARYVKYAITLRSCNQTETPKIISAAVVGPTGATSTTASVTTTTTTPQIFTWEGCVDGTGDLTIEGSEVTNAKGSYDGIGPNRTECTTQYRGLTKGLYSGDLTGCLKATLTELVAAGNTKVGISNRISFPTRGNIGPAFKVHIADNGTGSYNYKFTLNCTESVTPTPGPSASSTSTLTTTTTATNATTSSVPNPPVPCDAERPITCTAPNPVATTTTTVQANGGICSLQKCVAGQSATPTTTTVGPLFNTPSGSATGFLVNGIKSGLSFYLIIAGVLLISGVIIFRILKAE